MTVDISSKSVISFVLGTVTAGTNSLPTYGAKCAAASKFTATVNNWKGTNSALAIVNGVCVIGNSLDAAIVTGDTDEDASLGAISMAGSLSFD